MSPKPWAKYEVGFIDHPKFRVLNANAICLWLEGKNYCDSNMTDGLIPAHEIKRFRFRGQKTIAMLTTSAGPKNAAGDLWAPLWEAHPVGFKMHDYLDYNACRDEVVARLEQVERERQLDKERKAKARAAKREKVGVLLDVRPDSPVDGPVDVPLYTETESEVQTPSESGVTTPKPHPIRDLLGHYQTSYEQTVGVKPIIDGAKDAGMLQPLVKLHTVETIQRAMDAFFADGFAKERGFALGLFRSQFNTWLAKSTPAALRPRPVDPVKLKYGPKAVAQ